MSTYWFNQVTSIRKRIRNKKKLEKYVKIQYTFDLHAIGRKICIVITLLLLILTIYIFTHDDFGLNFGVGLQKLIYIYLLKRKPYPAKMYWVKYYKVYVWHILIINIVPNLNIT